MPVANKVVFGLAGWSGSGKTTLAEQLIAHFTAQGLNVATIKHAHHKFDADIPGKDSWRHRQAGAKQVLISSAARSVHFIEHQAEEPPLEALLQRLEPCDLVLLEGFKQAPVPKLEIYRSDLQKPLLYPEDNFIIGLVSDVVLPDCKIAMLDRTDIYAIASFILRHLGLEKG